MGRHQRHRTFVNIGDMRLPFTITAIENQHRVIRFDTQNIAQIMCRIAGEGERLVCRERLVYKQALNGFGFACHAFIPYHIIIGTRDIIGQSDKRKFDMTHSPPETERPADAAADNWVARFVPTHLRPYAELARFDRPIGGWLLFGRASGGGTGRRTAKHLPAAPSHRPVSGGRFCDARCRLHI